MNKLNTIIVEDEQHCEDRLKSLLKENHSDDIALSGIAHNLNEAEVLISTTRPDLIFLDVHLGNEISFDLFPRIDWQKLKIIFTTSYSKYSTEAFRFSAIDYLLKPIEGELLKEALEKVMLLNRHEWMIDQIEALRHNMNQLNAQSKRISVSTLESLEVLNVSEILYLQSDESYTEIHLMTNRKIVASKPLKFFDELLYDCDFFRIHQSYLINLKHFRRYLKSDCTAEMANGVTLPVSARKKDDFLKRISRN